MAAKAKKSQDLAQALAGLGVDRFLLMMQAVMWMHRGEEDFGLEVAYADDDLITFRLKKDSPLRGTSREDKP